VGFPARDPEPAPEKSGRLVRAFFWRASLNQQVFVPKILLKGNRCAGGVFSQAGISVYPVTVGFPKVKWIAAPRGALHSGIAEESCRSMSAAPIRAVRCGAGLVQYMWSMNAFRKRLQAK